MAREKHEKEINGITYVVETMDGVSALKAQTKLIKILGSGATKLKAGNLQLKDKDGKPDIKAIIDLLSPILDNFDDDAVSGFVLSLFAKGVFIRGTADGQKINRKIDVANDFSGKVNDLWQVAAFIIGVNFGLGEL